eukprot:CAMPEP_0201565138 /NCGR_PEP_ID=MMETSP0190_2-20130828/4011_1 /ASSEMBLY_ACC=CAM_ASM_000263 /TAXON_ID=37353 /ORGANISM="Rosalina sp." /LENGTH=103 /DNA_ID=CAMNT_0047982251 /DNA_START=57 /DNA_END=368 /DNA_ORIENTATION=-
MAAAAKSPFEQATEFVKNLPKDGDVQLDNAVKLKFYAWFKQGTVGKCSEKGGSQPWAVQVEARAKWDAWNALGDMTADDAKKAYVDELTNLTKDSKDNKFVCQ